MVAKKGQPPAASKATGRPYKAIIDRLRVVHGINKR